MELKLSLLVSSPPSGVDAGSTPFSGHVVFVVYLTQGDMSLLDTSG
jgi:hypothetical protein